MEEFHPHTQLKQDATSGMREAFVFRTGLDIHRFQHQSFSVVPAAFQCLTLLECDMGSLPNAFTQAFFSYRRVGLLILKEIAFAYLEFSRGLMKSCDQLRPVSKQSRFLLFSLLFCFKFSFDPILVAHSPTFYTITG